MRGLTSGTRAARQALGAPLGAVLVLAAAGALAGCGRGDEELRGARDVTESGAAFDVIGQPEGADSIPPRMEDLDPEPPLPPKALPPLSGGRETSGVDTAIRPPERRPIRNIPPLTKPDSQP
jgi:hypothetical protein